MKYADYDAILGQKMSADLLLPEADASYLENLRRGFCGPLACFGAVNHLMGTNSGRSLTRSAESGMMADVKLAMNQLLVGFP